MTTTLRARVWATNKFRNVPTKKWAVTAHARNEHGQIIAGQMRTAPSHPEAMQAAYKLLRDLDQELMHEVHASRAARRERCAECREPIAPGKAHWKLNEGPCMILPADQIDPDTAEATYPMEPTA